MTEQNQSSQQDVLGQENKFCLVMIVRDEAPVIQRCLTSVSTIATSYLICDTGSNDDTINIINQYMTSKNIPGEVITKEWKNFGYNKSYLMEQAHKRSMAKYIFFLDADEVFTKSGDAYNNVETEHSLYPNEADSQRLYEYLESKPLVNVFYLTTKFDGLEYQRWNIVRNNQLYRWDYPVHELLVATVNDSNDVNGINFFHLRARKQGNSSRNPQRYLNDAKQFEEYLAEHPGEPRCLFYLAQTYEGIDKRKAIENYIKRLDAAGYYQEKYIALLRLGRLVDDKLEKVRWWNRAIDFIPSRLEAYHELINVYHHTFKNNHIAYGYVKAAPASREPDRDSLFTEKPTYDWKFDLDASLVCHYGGYHEDAYKIGKSILDRKRYPDNQQSLLTNNMNFYIQKWNPML